MGVGVCNARGAHACVWVWRIVQGVHVHVQAGESRLVSVQGGWSAGCAEVWGEHVRVQEGGLVNVCADGCGHACASMLGQVCACASV